MPLSTLQVIPRDITCKTRGQDGFAASFPVGLFHPLQHAGLSRRSPDCRQLAEKPRVFCSTLPASWTRNDIFRATVFPAVRILASKNANPMSEGKSGLTPGNKRCIYMLNENRCSRKTYRRGTF